MRRSTLHTARFRSSAISNRRSGTCATAARACYSRRTTPCRAQRPSLQRRLLLPRQLPSPFILVQLRKNDRLPAPLELRALPELGVLEERVVDVHADRDQAAGSVEKAEVEDVIAQKLGDAVVE